MESRVGTILPEKFLSDTEPLASGRSSSSGRGRRRRSRVMVVVTVAKIMMVAVVVALPTRFIGNLLQATVL